MKQGLSKNKAAAQIAASKPYSTSWLKQEHVRLRESGELPASPPIGPEREAAIRRVYELTPAFLKSEQQRKRALADRARKLGLNLDGVHDLLTELRERRGQVERLAFATPNTMSTMLVGKYPSAEAAIAAANDALREYDELNEKVVTLESYLEAERNVEATRKRLYPEVGRDSG